MSYEPTNWKKGDKVTSTRLNKIEQGIQGNDTEISALKEELTDLFSSVNNTEYTDGYYIKYSDGTSKTITGSSVTDYIPVFEGMKITLKNYASAITSDARGYAFYDSSKNFISGAQLTGADITITVPENAEYIRFTVATSLKTTYTFFIDISALFTYLNSIESIDSAVNSLETKEELLRTNINPYGITLTANKYINSSNGNFSGNYNFSYATEGYIPVAPLSTIDLTDYADTSHIIENIVGLAFYSDDNTYISGISYAGNTSGIHATVPANATKMRITIFNNSVDSFVLRIDTTPSVKNLYFPVVSNPLDVIKESAGLTAVFHTVGCIGNSLASGESAYKIDGVTHYVDLYDFSWGQCLARMTGNTYYNFSAGGLSAKTWLTSQYCTTAFDGNHKCDAYIIGLGQNDKNQGYTVGTTADIDLSDYTQNADTFCGNYGKIIQMIQEHQPKAKIFVMTDMLEAVNTYGINAAIRSVAELFDNVYVLDFYQYGANYVKSGFLYNQYRSGHFNAIGYQYIAWMIATYIDWYIKNHQSEFAQVEFIGTDYAW